MIYGTTSPLDTYVVLLNKLHAQAGRIQQKVITCSKPSSDLDVDNYSRTSMETLWNQVRMRALVR